MELRSEDQTEEVKRLRRCINDLVSITSLPAVWAGRDHIGIMRTLIDALLPMLRLNFIYVRLEGASSEPPLETLRVAPAFESTIRLQEVRELADQWLEPSLQQWSASSGNLFGHREVSVTSTRLGLRRLSGVLVAGASRADFPTQTETLLINVATNQAAIGFQDALLLSEERRLASELDQRIAQKTSELTAANEELWKEIFERSRVEEAMRESERRFHEVQMELAHANRVATMGELAASIAHEVNQPLAALLTSAETALRWLDRQPPNLERAEQSIERAVDEGKRAADIVSRIRDLSRKAPVRREQLDINATILGVMGLTRAALSEKGVSAKMQLAESLPPIFGDRVQLQQVILNLIMNAVEAMSEVSAESRGLLISTGQAEAEGILVAVSDSGPGLPQDSPQRVFDAFYTTKPSGLGLGLSICRSIVEAHGGRLWANPNEPRGTVFSFTVPIGGIA